MRQRHVQDEPELFASRTEGCDGFFYCGHCHHVADLPPEAEVNQTYKCPRCRKWTVVWKFSSPVKRRLVVQGVSQERGRELFAALHAVIDG